jgi:hypothetical protein
MSSSKCDWRTDYLARAVNSALLRGRCGNQAALVASGSATEADVRRWLMFWLVQRTMTPQPEHRLPAGYRNALEVRTPTQAAEACTCDHEPPPGQELSAA